MKLENIPLSEEPQRWLQERLASLSDEELKWDYLNDLEWTEPIALMMELLEDEEQAVRVVKLALEVDWQLGARLAGEVKPEFQKQTVSLVTELPLPQLLKVKLAGITKSDAAVPRLIQVLAELQQENMCRIVTEALSKMGSDATIPRLIQALDDSDTYVRRQAVRALGEIGTDAAIPELIQALDDSNDSVRSLAVEALGKIGTDAAIPGLIQALDDSQNYLRRKAVEALGKIGSDAGVPGLIKAREHSNDSVRSPAAEALGKIGTDAAIPVLVKALDPGLIKALQKPNLNVRTSASSALSNMDSDATIPELIKALQDQNFAEANSGDTLNRTLTVLKTIQERCQYYRPTPEFE